METDRLTSRIVAVLIAGLAWGVASGQGAIDPAGEQQRMQIDEQVKKPYTVKLELTTKTQRCQAQVELEYTQRNTLASVSGEISNPQCAASSGNYTMAVRYRDEDGEIHNVEYEEAWQRDDDQNFVFDKAYSIGENVDLVRVRARKVSCTCTEAPNDGAEPEMKGENDDDG